MTPTEQFNPHGLAANETDYRVRKSLYVSGSRHRVRLFSKLLRSLRDEVARLHPDTALPSSWIIRCLVQSIVSSSRAPIETPSLSGWDEPLAKLLRSLCHRIQVGESAELYELDGTTPLFPNNESFTSIQAYQFANLALKQLHATTSYKY